MRGRKIRSDLRWLRLKRTQRLDKWRRLSILWVNRDGAAWIKWSTISTRYYMRSLKHSLRNTFARIGSPLRNKYKLIKSIIIQRCLDILKSIKSFRLPKPSTASSISQKWGRSRVAVTDVPSSSRYVVPQLLERARSADWHNLSSMQ